MNGAESSKTYLHPKAPTTEQAEHFVLQLRNERGSLPVAVTNLQGQVVMQIGLNPLIQFALTHAGAEQLGERLLAASGRWRRVQQDAVEIYGDANTEPVIDIAGQDTDGGEDWSGRSPEGEA